MTPTFQLHADYVARDVEFVLSRVRRGWQFFGRDAQGYCVPARNPKGELLCTGTVFATQREAAFMAETLSLPAYATWNGRKRAYDGKGATLRAFPRQR